jgi:hypothetical protein
MLAVVMATLLLTAGQGSEAGQSAPPPPTSTPLSEAKDNLDRAEALYTQSCGDRSYGAYDDLCSQLGAQVKQYRVELDRQQRAADRESSASRRPKS